MLKFGVFVGVIIVAVSTWFIFFFWKIGINIVKLVFRFFFLLCRFKYR